MHLRWRKCWIGCCDDWVALRHQGLARRRHHRHAVRLQWPGCKGADGVRGDPFSGHVFVFCGWRGDLIKLLWWTGDGLCLLAKRRERGRFIWLQASNGSVRTTLDTLSRKSDTAAAILF
ncbi:IS66 family insertion sequence element accessory protein TnpB [Pseudoduganella aquatica]|uniref:IS66 family insertion sequence element accessory protein TnpB n=1 Tax=Pseudoduganella aquatica TaxID=2660641 RepID=UPI00389B27CC